MKRLVVVFVVLLPLSWCLAGCGGGASSPTSSSNPTKEQQNDMRKAQMEMMKKNMGSGPGGFQKK